MTDDGFVLEKIQHKYPRELLQHVRGESDGIATYVKKLGLAPSGRNNEHMRIISKNVNVDLGDWAEAKAHGDRRTAQEIFAQTTRQHNHELRRALEEIGRVVRCVGCGTSETWMDESLTLHVDHRDGNNCNNHPDNLRFLCPNCHSQTDTYTTIKTRAKIDYTRGKKDAARHSGDVPVLPACGRSGDEVRDHQRCGSCVCDGDPA